MNRTDNFNRADSSSLGTPSDGGSPWQSSVFGVEGNQAKTVGGEGYQTAVLECGSGDGVVQATLASVANYGGLAVRWTNDSNFVWVASYNGDWGIHKLVNGTQLTVATTQAAHASGDVVAVELSGASITVKRNGQVVLTGNDSFNSGATKHGLFGVVTPPSARWDDFGFTDGGAPPPPPPPPPSDLKLGWIGDSTWALQYGYGNRTEPEVVKHLLEKMGGIRSVEIVNRAVSGTDSFEWAAGTQRLADAKTAFAAAGVTHVLYRVGLNDTHGNANQFDANMGSTVNDLVAAGYKVILCYCTWRGDVPPFPDCLPLYHEKIDARIDPPNVLQGDTLAFDWFAAHQDELDQPLIHPQLAGVESAALMTAFAVYRAIYGEPGGGQFNVGDTVIISFNGTLQGVIQGP